VGAYSLSVSAAVCCTATECLSALAYNACLASGARRAPVGGRFDMYVFVYIFLLAQEYLAIVLVWPYEMGVR